MWGKETGFIEDYNKIKAELNDPTHKVQKCRISIYDNDEYLKDNDEYIFMKYVRKVEEK